MPPGGRLLFYKSYKAHKSYAEALFPAWGDKHASKKSLQSAVRICTDMYGGITIKSEIVFSVPIRTAGVLRRRIRTHPYHRGASVRKARSKKSLQSAVVSLQPVLPRAKWMNGRGFFGSGRLPLTRAAGGIRICTDMYGGVRRNNYKIRGCLLSVPIRTAGVLRRRIRTHPYHRRGMSAALNKTPACR